MFKITGIINNKEYKILWKNGNLTGDAEAVEIAQTENKKKLGVIGLQPEATNENYLSYEIPAFYFLKLKVFDKIKTYSTDWPPENPNAIY